jgi:hypothetical protein
MMELIGRQGNVVLFSSDDGMGVLVDEESNRVLAVDSFNTLVASGTYEETADVTKSSQDLADAALTTLNINVIPTTDRMHTIPKAVQTEARRSLDWHAKHGRGGTPVGLHTASILAEGGQIGIKKIRHIAQYFPRHAMDASCQGYSPKDEGYPNKGRISWGLRGGDAAQKWATGVVERENRKQGLSIVASNGYYDHEKPLPVSIESFTEPDPEFAARVRTDGGGIDRLYKMEADGSVFVWDDGCWDDLGNIDHDIATYDRALDDAYDKSDKYYVAIDRESAITLAALFDADPFTGKDQYGLAADEADLILAAADEIDWNEIDSITAAGVPDDGKYTPQERSENVKSQVRDRSGRFAESGSNIIVGGDSKKKGKILSIDGITKKAKVKMADGRTVDIPVNLTEKDEDPTGSTEETPTPKAVDTTGILGEERKPQDKGIARLPKDLPVLSPDEVKEFLRDYPSHVANSRSAKKEEPVTAAGTDQSNDTDQPAGSDIKPINMAIVAEDDPQAVLELVSLIPANANSTTPITFKRKPGVWERDDSILADLNSPTPPPVVMLDDETLNTVMQQIDAAEEDSAPAPEPEAAPVTAAGGLDRNRGNAEKLRRYWLYGEGAAKIRWNTGGDWKRCVKQLAKHLGPRAKGYCALRHKEATGMWTGDQKHRQMYGRTASGATYSNDFILSTNEIIQSAITRARVADARRRVLTAGAPPEGRGAAFCIPLLLPEEIESGDGRKFTKGSLEMRELPLPLLWQIKTGPGHDGSVVVGMMESMERIEGGIGNVHGHFDTGEFGREAERLVRLGFFRGVSADLDMFEADVEVEDAKDATTGEDTKVETGRMSISKGRVMAATIVAKPAFQEATIHIVDPEGLQESQQEEDVVPDGVYVEDVDALEASALVACGIVAGVIPVAPPADWFENPKLKSATPLTVGDDGRVYGHIAAWHVDHIGMSFGTRPPKSRSNYAYFHTGVVRTDEGSDIPVGQLTLAGGHASLEMSAQEAVRHYDDTASAIADVHAGEDAYGIWVSGALRPGTTPEQIRALRASAPSGDWRPIKGRLELVGVLQVNVPGFPIARSRVASGQVMALVAAGASTLARMKHDPMSELNARVARLENEAAAPALTAAASDARSRMESMTAQIMDKRRSELSARVGQRKREISSSDDSKESHPPAELSFRDRIAIAETLLPAEAELSIRDRIAAVEASIMNNSGDLETSSASEFAKAKNPLDDLTDEELDALKQEKVNRENEKTRADKAPEIPLDENGEPLAPGVKPEGLKVTPQAKGKYTAKTQPRDAQGQFRLVLARLKSDIGDAGLDKLLKKVEDTENLDHAGDYAGAVGASQELLETIDRLDSGALDATAIGNVRKTAGELGKVIANLPFNFENQAAKIRFSDVPPTLRDLMEQMIKRVEAKIGSKDAAIATQGLKSFMSGSDVMSQSDISTEMSKLLRLLT